MRGCLGRGSRPGGHVPTSAISLMPLILGLYMCSTAQATSEGTSEHHLYSLRSLMAVAPSSPPELWIPSNCPTAPPCAPYPPQPKDCACSGAACDPNAGSPPCLMSAPCPAPVAMVPSPTSCGQYVPAAPCASIDPRVAYPTEMVCPKPCNHVTCEPCEAVKEAQALGHMTVDDDEACPDCRGSSGCAPASTGGCGSDDDSEEEDCIPSAHKRPLSTKCGVGVFHLKCPTHNCDPAVRFRKYQQEMCHKAKEEDKCCRQAAMSMIIKNRVKRLEKEVERRNKEDCELEKLVDQATEAMCRKPKPPPCPPPPRSQGGPPPPCPVWDPFTPPDVPGAPPPPSSSSTRTTKTTVIELAPPVYPPAKYVRGLRKRKSVFRGNPPTSPFSSPPSDPRDPYVSDPGYDSGPGGYGSGAGGYGSGPGGYGSGPGGYGSGPGGHGGNRYPPTRPNGGLPPDYPSPRDGSSYRPTTEVPPMRGGKRSRPINSSGGNNNSNNNNNNNNSNSNNNNNNNDSNNGAGGASKSSDDNWSERVEDEIETDADRRMRGGNDRRSAGGSDRVEGRTGGGVGDSYGNDGNTDSAGGSGRSVGVDTLGPQAGEDPNADGGRSNVQPPELNPHADNNLQNGGPEGVGGLDGGMGMGGLATSLKREDKKANSPPAESAQEQKAKVGSNSNSNSDSNSNSNSSSNSSTSTSTSSSPNRGDFNAGPAKSATASSTSVSGGGDVVGAVKADPNKNPPDARHNSRDLDSTETPMPKPISM